MCIEDCMQVVKKAYDKDILALEDYLKQIRMLANKQARQQIKLNKLLRNHEMDNLLNLSGARNSQMH